MIEMSTQQAIAVQGLCVAASKKYTISAKEPFDVKCIRWDDSIAEVVNVYVGMNDGRYVMSFETVGDARILINGEEVTL